MNTLKEIKVSYRNSAIVTDQTRINTSRDADAVFRNIWADNMDFCESFYLLCLNRNNRVIGWIMLSQGGLCGTVVDVRHLFSIALKTNSAGVVVAHNHPSGALSPSNHDNEITQKIKQAGKLLDVPLIDHLILTSEGFYSFSDEGAL